MKSPIVKLGRQNKKYNIALSIWLGIAMSDTQRKSEAVPGKENLSQSSPGGRTINAFSCFTTMY